MNPFGAAWRLLVSASAREFVFAPAQLEMRLCGRIPFAIAYSDINACGLRTTTADIVTRRSRVFGHKERVILSTRQGRFVFEPADRAKFLEDLVQRCPRMPVRDLADRSATVDLTASGPRIKVTTDAQEV